MRTVAILGLLLLLVLAWTLWSRTDDQLVPEPAPTATETAAGGTSASAEVPAAAAPAASVEATAERTEVPAAPPVSAGPDAVLRGRCVDEQGLPIAGVKAELSGWGGDTERMDAWRKDHGQPKHINVNATTLADGAFEIRFWPPPPFMFMVRLTKPGVASMSGQWSQFEPGVTKDLGDVRMLRGTLLGGRVVDNAGAPVATAEVRFNRSVRSGGEISPEFWDVTRAKADGTFTGRWSLLAGEYSVVIPYRTVVSPKSVMIAGDLTEQFVEVVVEAIDESQDLAGIVVDELGVPVSGVLVRPLPVGWANSADAQGQFRIHKPAPGCAEEVSLSLEREGYERLTTAETFRWGRTDIRLSLQRAIGVELTVVEADGAPVEDYQVRMFPQPGTAQGINSRDFDVRKRGRHEGGRTKVQGIRRGRYVVIVEPKGDALAPSSMVPIEVADPGPTMVTVVLARSINRELRVQRADGTPVAGARVQLADALGPELTPSGRVTPLSRWGLSSHNDAVELQSATTDAQGCIRLHGPGDRTLALVLPGPGHVPTVVTDVRLADAQPLVVTVASGAMLRGTLSPTSLVGELRRWAGLPPTGAVEGDRSYLPRIEMYCTDGPTGQTHGSWEQPITIAEDGTFATTGIPPGTWQVRLVWVIKGDQVVPHQEDVAVVTLQDGDNRDIEIDATQLMPGVLESTVLHNGAPLARTSVCAGCRLAENAQGHERVYGHWFTTDAEGRFRLRGRAGQYSLTWRVAGDGPLRIAPETIHVVAGQTVAQTFRFDTGTVRVRLLDAKGQPIAAVPIELRDHVGTLRHTLPATDADGRTADEVDVVSFTASVLPKHLQDPKAQMEFHRNSPRTPDPLAAARLQCGTVLAQMAATTDVELRLPVAWPR